MSYMDKWRETIGIIFLRSDFPNPRREGKITHLPDDLISWIEILASHVKDMEVQGRDEKKNEGRCQIVSSQSTAV